MRLLNFIFVATLLSCNSKKRQDAKPAVQNEALKPYQNYCLNILKKIAPGDTAYAVSDSFRLWTGHHAGKTGSPLYITRIIHDGWYAYIFWKQQQDSFIIYLEAAAPIVAFAKDSLYDVNGDHYKDLVITENTMNGHCQPQFSRLFCFDVNGNGFVEIEKVSQLPNVKFNPEDKTLSGEMECKMIKDMYKFKWKENFRLDTVYYKTINL